MFRSAYIENPFVSSLANVSNRFPVDLDGKLPDPCVTTIVKIIVWNELRVGLARSSSLPSNDGNFPSQIGNIFDIPFGLWGEALRDKGTHYD